MTPPTEKASRWRLWAARLPNWLAGGVIVLIVAAIAILVLDLQQQTRRLAASAADNMQWTLGQAEVELMALEIAALHAAQGEGSLSEVRLRYDIFFSRIDTLTQSHRFAELLTIGVMPDRIKEITRFRDQWLPLIDGPDAELAEALPRLATDASFARGAVRDTTLAGVEHFSQLGFEQRDSLGKSMVRVGVLTMALVAMLVVLALMMFRLARNSDAEARANRETRERIETILSTSLDAVVVSDATGRIVDYNGAAERIFGYERSAVIGADMATLIVPAHFRDAHRRGMARFRQGGAPRVIGKGIVQLDAQRRDGTVFPVDLSLAQAHSPEGEIYIAFMRDISDRVRSEAELKRARDRAIAGEKQKAELLAVMSHEMRTPLNGMLGTLELVDEQVLDSRHQRYLRIVRDSGRILLRHVNDVLDISRLDAGKMTLSKTAFDLIALLEDVIDNQREHARARGNRIVLVPPNPELHRVHGDPDRLRQILLNLVGNAVKFTRNGRITIEADCADGLDPVELRVTDTGIGIAEEDLDRIFEDFVTIDSTYGRSTSGTGLGLGISRRLATILGGELGVESEPGDGSIFWLRLPLAPPEHRDLPPPAQDQVAPAALPPASRILLVEDNETNRLVGQDLLEHDGHRVSTAVSGEAALSVLATQRFDVVMMDISMPGMDGIDASRALRAGGGLNADTPVVATTAHALPQEVQAFYGAGMQAVLIKPLTLDAIRRTLNEVLLGGGKVTPEIPKTLPPDGPLIDRGHLDSMRRDLPMGRLQELHDRFQQELGGFVAALPGMIDGIGDDFGPLAAEAHRMAGTAGLLGATRLTAQLRLLQEEARARDRAAVVTRQAAVATCWQATQEALASETGAAATLR